MIMRETFILLVGCSIATLSAAEDLSPRDLVIRFCRLDAQGALLTEAGWQTVRPLLATPRGFRRDFVGVIQAGDVGQPVAQDDKLHVPTSPTPLGVIDSVLARFTPYPPGMYVKGGYLVSLHTDFVDIPGSPGDRTKWRIEGEEWAPHVTVDVAIRYVSELRAKAKDATIRGNADESIAALKRLR